MKAYFTITATLLAMAVGIVCWYENITGRKDAEIKKLAKEAASLRSALSAREGSASRTPSPDVKERELAAQDAAVGAAESALEQWLGDVQKLKAHLFQNPEEAIPELQLLMAKDWLDASKEGGLLTDMDIRRALCELRASAKRRFAAQLKDAWAAFTAAHQGGSPSDVSQLAPFFNPPMDPAILHRYGPPTKAQLASLPSIGMPGISDGWIIIEKAPAGLYYDTSFFFSQRGGMGVRDLSVAAQEVDAAVVGYKAANNGLQPTSVSQIAPFLRVALDSAFVQQRIRGTR